MTMSRLSSNSLGQQSANILRAVDVTSTTGGPTTSTFTDANSVNWTVYKFLASGSITFGNSGLADILVVGAGAGGYNTGAYYFGGGGGGVRTGFYELGAGSYTITVGAGSAVGLFQVAGLSEFGTLGLKAGGGMGITYYSGPVYNVSYLGNDNGSGRGYFAIGSDPGNYDGLGAGTGTAGGIASSITGSSVTYGKGGLAGSTQSSTNYGGGGAYNQTGIQGVVIVRVRTA